MHTGSIHEVAYACQTSMVARQHTETCNNSIRRWHLLWDVRFAFARFIVLELGTLHMSKYQLHHVDTVVLAVLPLFTGVVLLVTTKQNTSSFKYQFHIS